MMEQWEESRMEIKENIKLEREKQAWKNLMYAINNMGTIPQEPTKYFYREYHRNWDVLIDRARIYRRIANLDEKYGLDEEV